MLVQYWRFVKGIVVGADYDTGPTTEHCPAPCFGYSFMTQKPVWPDLLDRLPVTALARRRRRRLWLVAGVATGVLSALRRGSVFDRAAMGVALAGVSLPIFFTGLLSLAVFSTSWTGSPPGGSYTPFTENPARVGLRPAAALGHAGLPLRGVYARLTRAGMLETMNEDYIRTARAKGLPERAVVVKHGLRSALTPILTIFGLDLGLLLGGAVLTESTFSLPGLGKYAVDAITNNDLPKVLGVVMLGAFFIVLANLDRGHPVRGRRPPGAAHMTASTRTSGGRRRPAAPSPAPSWRCATCRCTSRPTTAWSRRSTGSRSALERGRTLGIVGESGSGKSVTSLAIMGLHKGTRAQVSGEIWLDGQELIGAAPDEVRQLRGRKMAMIFQDPLSAMHPFYTIGDADRRGVPGAQRVSQAGRPQRAVEMLDRVGIPQPDRRVDDYPHQFSGGMRQRAMIAMALVNNPDLLIADEPTTALDVTVQAQIPT